MNERKAQLKQKAISEAKKFATIVSYLWALFIAVELHKASILRQQNISFDFKIGFALVNALVLGKVILLGQAMHLGERYSRLPLLLAVLLKSAAFAVLLIVFETAEDIAVGLFHHKAILQSLPSFGGGGVQGLLLVFLMAFIVLIPFFALSDLARELGEEDIYSAMFRPGTPRL